ncbi:Alpha/Beta hydrolase protein [Xylariomycetidae sp. FL2044]|nr:Alpha/Beta hydrolase protein [Xylariomycetidae sp. FL2044]
MTLSSDLTINPQAFTIRKDVEQLNQVLSQQTAKGERWYEIGAPRYRVMWEAGETWLPKPVFLPGAQDADIPSRDPGRTIPVRVYQPDGGKQPRGLLLYFHGGGWCLGSHTHDDALLQRHANTSSLISISVGYRLAPESPFPAGLEDSIDAVRHYAARARDLYGVPLAFLRGDSAGATLALQAAVALLRQDPGFLQLADLLLGYGCYDLSMSMPSRRLVTSDIFLTRDALAAMRAAYLPGRSAAEMQTAEVSPLYDGGLAAAAAPLGARRLPPALFMCGTEDVLFDDSVLMGTRWTAAGAEAVVRIFGGAPHAFDRIPGTREAQEAEMAVNAFVEEKLGRFCQ